MIMEQAIGLFAIISMCYMGLAIGMYIISRKE